ncbi:Endonuclease/exonuclease/phosphatase, partial [Mycena sanguinolenta]
LIVQVLLNGLQPADCPDPEQLNHEINTHLASHPESSHLKVVSHKWTNNGHCIIFTRADQTAAELIEHEHWFVDAIAPGCNTRALLDTKWIKIQVDGVCTGAYDLTPTIYSEETLRSELAEMNVVLQQLKGVQPPHWMRSKEEIARNARSSIVFAVEDTEQAHHLLREVKVMVYYQKRADFEVTLRSDIAKDPDIQIVEVSQHGALTTTFVNVYNDTKQRRSAAVRIRSLNLPQDQPVIYLGDFNLHHELWSCLDKHSNTHSRSFLEWITEDENGPQATLFNKKGEITYIPHDSERVRSVIDLTFANGAAIAHDIIQEWTIDPTMSYSSDHLGIRWVMDLGRTEVENTTGTQYSLKETDPKDWCAAFRTELANARPDINQTMDEDRPVSNEQLEQAARALTNAMREATAKVGKV